MTQPRPRNGLCAFITPANSRHHDRHVSVSRGHFADASGSILKPHIAPTTVDTDIYMEYSVKPSRAAAAACFILVFVGLMAVGRTRMLRDPGTLWHTVAGQRMLDEGQILRTDPFSFTRGGEEWVAQQWLGECAMAIVHQAAGLDGLLLSACVAIALIFSFLTVRAARCGLPGPLVVLFLLIILAASSYHFMPRPHLATLLFMSIGTALLCDVENGRAGPMSLLAIPPVMLLWSNLHGGALGGMASLVLVSLGWLVRFNPPAPWKGARFAVMLVVVVGLSGAAILVNPFGAALPRTWFGLMGSEVLPKIIIEHAPTELLSGPGMIVLLVGAIYFALLATVLRQGLRTTWLLPAVWFVLALSRVRHAPIFSMVAGVTILDMIPHSSLGRRLAQFGGPVQENATSGTPFGAGPALAARPANWPIACAFLVPLIAFGLQSAGIRVPVLGAAWARLDPAYWPVEATKRLEERLRGTTGTGRVFNDLRYGGYLIYASPRTPIYIDDRCELYRDEGLCRYVELLKRPERLAGEAAYRDISFALVRSDSRPARFLANSSEWTVLHRDATASLFERRTTTANDQLSSAN